MSLTHQQAAQAIRTAFRTLVETPLSLMTQYDNLPFDHPDNVQWAKVTISPADSQQASLGASKTFRTPGILQVQLKGPLNVGEKPLYDLAENILVAFRSVTISGVTFRTPSLFRVGRVGGEYQVNVSCPWYFETID